MKQITKKIVVMLILAMAMLLQVQNLAAKEVSSEKLTGWVKEGKDTYYYNTKHKKTTGWKKIEGNTYYFFKKDEKKPEGAMAAGFVWIDEKRFYFSEEGVLQTGWKKIGSKYYYFEPKGVMGERGSTKEGFQIIDNGRYFFNKSGSARTGWNQYKSYRYYCSKKAGEGVYGRAISGGWTTLAGKRYFFTPNGVVLRNIWIKGGNYWYYMSSDGHKLTNTITPDGWVVNGVGQRTVKASGWVNTASGIYYCVGGKKTTGWKKINGKLYYFNESGVRQDGMITIGSAVYYLKQGVMQTGWQKIDGKKYYFKSNGKMAKNTVVDGIRLDENGKADVDIQILIIAGHGQGDVGATAVYGSKTLYEYQYNREFANLIRDAIKDKSSKIKVTMYDQRYDCYKVLSGKASGPKPQLKLYDYVLEIHFNATAVSSKDLKGNKAYKGTGIYISAAKKDYAIDKAIVNAIVATGFKQWGCGVFASSTLFNPKVCQNQGVSYGLLETAFIDDKDDMLFYSKNKKKMAQAVAGALIDYFE